MRVFGLTGGIASGKSTVAARFRQTIPVIDADVLAREVVEPGEPALAEIRARFGDRVMTPGGSLDRSALATIVFGDDEARAALNAIVHPRVRERLLQRLQQLAAEGHDVACYEVPLLFEAGLEDGLRPVVLVSAAPSTQVERAMARNDLTREQAEARVGAQLPLEVKAQRADYVIQNDGGLRELHERADAVLSDVLAQLRADEG